MSVSAASMVDREFVARVDRWVDRMHDASQNIVGSSPAAVDICRTVLESLWERRGDLTSADLTGSALLLAARQLSLERLEKYGWSAPGAAQPVASLDLTESSEVFEVFEPVEPAVRYRVLLAHAAATVLGADNISLVDLHDRHGVDAASLEMAGEVGTLRLARLRSDLGEALAAFTLWNGGQPGCADLAALLDDVDELDVSPFEGERFDSALFDVIDRHRQVCEHCTDEHRSLVNPAGLLLTTRIATVTLPIRQQMLPFATGSFAGRTIGTVPSTLAAITADQVDAARRPDDDDDIAELWESTNNAAAASRVVPARPSRRRTRPGTSPILAAAAAVVVVVAGGAVLATQVSNGDDRVITDTPADDVQPSESGTPEPTGEQEPEVRSLGPVPPVLETSSTSTTVAATSAMPPATDPVTLLPLETSAPAPTP